MFRPFLAFGVSLTVGGYILYIIKGTTMSEIKPGIKAAINQSVQVKWICAVLAAKSCASGLPAIAVKNIAAVIKFP